MIEEPFATGDSIVHKLDPRARIVFATVYSFVVAFAVHFPVLLTAMAISGILASLSGIGLKDIARRRTEHTLVSIYRLLGYSCT